MSNRSPKRSILTERKVRRVIREEINTRYGNRLTARQKVMLEQGIIQGVKNALGGIFGVGAEGAAYVGKKIGNIGTGIEKAVASVKSAYATGKLGPASKAFNDLFSKTREAGEQLVGMHTAAGEPVPEKLKQFNTAAAALTAKEIKAEEAKNKPPATGTPAAAAPTGGATTAAAPTGGATTAAAPTGGATTAAAPTGGATTAAAPTGGATGAAPVAIKSLQGKLSNLAGKDPEKKKQVAAILKALSDDLTTGKITINESAGLVKLTKTAAALKTIKDPALLTGIKKEIIAILSNVAAKVDIKDIEATAPVAKKPAPVAKKPAPVAKKPAPVAKKPAPAAPPATIKEEFLRRKYRL